MKITIDIGLDDLLEEIEDYDYENDDYHTYCTYKDTEQLRNDVTQMILDEISKGIIFDYDWFSKVVKEILTNNKQEIVDGVIKEVSKKIINQKAIKDFKKGLEE